MEQCRHTKTLCVMRERVNPENGRVDLIQFCKRCGHERWRPKDIVGVAWSAWDMRNIVSHVPRWYISPEEYEAAEETLARCAGWLTADPGGDSRDHARELNELLAAITTITFFTPSGAPKNRQ